MANQKISINPQDLIPKRWDYKICIPTEEDLIFIGSKNIKRLRVDWQKERRYMYGRLRAINNEIDLFSNMTLSDIKKIAAEYENPESLYGDSINRKFGATTFNVCGWCKYCIERRCSDCDGGRCRECTSTAACSLIPLKAQNNIHFDTPCVLANGTQDALDACVAHMKVCRAELPLRIQQVTARIRYLTRMLEKSEEKPCFSHLRPCGYFNIGDSVMFHTSSYDFVVPSKVCTFVSGKVVPDPDHCKKGLEVRTDEPFRTRGSHNDGYHQGFGVHSKRVLHTWEYDYLRSHTDYLRVWVRSSAIFDGELDREEFIGDFLKG